MCDNSIKLLEKVIAKIDELKSIDSDSYENFNILSILGKEADEVIMCKILWAILDHKIGGQRLLLKGFVKDILNMSLEESEYDSSSVYREDCIPDNSRRIDLVIKTKKHFIPIEAKIYAEDQAKQCADYIRFAGRYYKPSLERLNSYCKCLKGEIDCASFASSGDESLSTMRYIEKAHFFTQKNFPDESEVLVFEIEANAFLWKMVRTITGTLINLDKKNAPEDSMKKILDCKDRTKAGVTAPAKGLFLYKINFDGIRRHK